MDFTELLFHIPVTYEVDEFFDEDIQSMKSSEYRFNGLNKLSDNGDYFDILISDYLLFYFISHV